MPSCFNFLYPPCVCYIDWAWSSTPTPPTPTSSPRITSLSPPTSPSQSSRRPLRGTNYCSPPTSPLSASVRRWRPTRPRTWWWCTRWRPAIAGCWPPGIGSGCIGRPAPIWRIMWPLLGRLPVRSGKSVSQWGAGGGGGTERLWLMIKIFVDCVDEN